MAAIDKIYGTEQQYWQLKEFLEESKPEFLPFLYTVPPEGFKGQTAISNFSSDADYWLMQHCPLEFVHERLKEQYGEDYVARRVD